MYVCVCVFTGKLEHLLQRINRYIRKKIGTCLFRGENDDGDGKEDRKWEQNPLEKMEEERLKQIEMQ